MHVIERSTEEVDCTTCDRVIAEGEPRFAEEIVGDDGKFARSLRYARTPRPYDPYDDDRRDESGGPAPETTARYYHLTCAAKAVPMRLSPALAQYAMPADKLAELQRLMHEALTRERRPIDPAADADETRPDYERFIAQLAEATDDEGNVVFGDWLQTVDDPRGQLISLQLQLETATGWAKDRLVETERKLLASNRQLLPGKSDAFGWRRGFVHSLSMPALRSDEQDVLAHPSLQLVRELHATTYLPSLPPTLRVLEIDSWTTGELSSVARLARLQRLKLPFEAPLVLLQHPTLATLELASPQLPAACELPPATQLPALRRLVVRLPRDLARLVELLARSSLARDELVLVGHLEVGQLAPLRHMRLALLDLLGTPLAHTDLEAVRALATTVLLPPPPVENTKVWRVRHLKRREWGLGRVIDETEEGLRVEFDEVGEKLVRNVELLEDVD